ncbi:MAG: hypothetical protein HY900_05340 [Deltaproteobacteria bacterium]|nr:hypothetical protein [Deltaproteobacteria bacterium]
MRCSRCDKEISAEDAVNRGGQLVCEDCLMDLLSPAKACDPWAVKMAKGSMGTTADAIASLRGVEKRLYELVCERGGVPKVDLPALLEVSLDQVDRAIAVLRHMELVRGHKAEDGRVLCVRF